MNEKDPEGHIKVTVERRGDMDSELERAVQRLIERAQHMRDRGITITRHSARDFTVQLDKSVPFGITREKQDW